MTHLLFADDSIVFLEGTQGNLEELRNILQVYEQASGQRVNLQKSSIFFGRNCPDSVKTRVKNSLGIQNETFHDSYLVMPTEVGSSPISTFKFLTDIAWQNIHGWSDRPLSRVGNETLPKSITQAIPTFVRDAFVFLLLLVKSLDRLWLIGSGVGRMEE